MSVFIDTNRKYIIAFLIFILSFTIYLVTLAPTLIWGDSAKFVCCVHLMQFDLGASGHPLHILLGKLFNFLPIGDLPFRLNLMSAFFAALTVVFFYTVILKLTKLKVVSVITAFVFGLSHTFWLEAVIAEVYTIHTFFLSLLILLLLMWREKGDRKYLYWFAFLFGLSLSNHLLMLFFLPGFLYFLLANHHRKCIDIGTLLSIAVFFLIGSSFYLGLLFSTIISKGWVDLIKLIAGGRGINAYFAYSLAGISMEFVKFFAYLFYQFPFPGFIFGIWGMVVSFRKENKVFMFLTILFLPLVIFNINYKMLDKYALYLSVYLIFAIWVGIGLSSFFNRIDKRLKMTIAGLLLLCPVLLYSFTPSVCDRFNIDLLKVRDLPYRDNNSYFLFPPKHGYYGAYRYGKDALEIMKPNAKLIADFTPWMVIGYFQVVEGMRPDVEMVWMENPDNLLEVIDLVSYINEHIQKFPVYFADNTPDDYKIEEVTKEYDLISVGPIFEIKRKVGNSEPR